MNFILSIDIMVSHWKASALQWIHNERDGVSNHRRLDCLFRAAIKEDTKAPRHWPLWGESIDGWRIPLTKGQ